ncbi:hypothetical protein [Reinekea marinisedimentorum]|uniref:Uncharacterized protein n=1 Tax=Reinekea marinisedimentorum TaxID=230495 RepID=A0A4R3HR18_9GAMM|nr:hypothetical protein [Reinekea marinisedimentorum]TCS34793.1 hypothetical protein BCF53_1396 [Reinekea marinisedimentorum]
MNYRLWVYMVTLLASVNTFSESLYPSPSSWQFPDIVESAIEISPKNIEGKPFNAFGLAYSVDDLEILDLARIELSELQKYADVVTHAYPDAVFVQSQLAVNCSELSITQVNETSIAGIAYIYFNAVVEEHRALAGQCINALLDQLQIQH